jgi:hypothetical protein
MFAVVEFELRFGGPAREAGHAVGANHFLLSSMIRARMSAAYLLDSTGLVQSTRQLMVPTKNCKDDGSGVTTWSA